MSSTNKEILFSARDNGVESTMSKLRRSAKELSQDMLRDAKASSNSQKEQIQHFEQQIRLIERRNSLDAESQKIQAKERLDRKLAEGGGSGARKEYKQTMGQIGSDSKTDSIQTKLLREIADGLKLDSRKDFEKDSRDSDEGGSGMGRRGAGMSSSDTGFGRMRGPRVDVAGYLQGVHQMMGASTGSQALMGAGGTLMSQGGILGKVGGLMNIVGMVGEIANMSRDATAGIESNMMLNSAITGMSVGTQRSRAFGDISSQYGYSRNEFYSSIMPQVMQSRGGMEMGGASAERIMEMSRATGLDMGTLMQIERVGSRGMSREGLSRTFSGSLNSWDEQTKDSFSESIIEKIIGSHEGTTAFRTDTGKLDLSRLQDSMQAFLGLQGSMMQRSGNLTNMNPTLTMSAQLERMGGIYRNDDYKFNTISSIDRGLSSQGSAESQAIKMQILRKAMPSASYSELMEEMDKGIGSEALTSGAFNFVKNTGGDKNSQAILMHQLFGGNVNWADVNRLTGTGEDFNIALENTKANTRGTSIGSKGRAAGAVGDAVRSQIKDKERLEDVKSDPGKHGWNFLGEKMENVYNGIISLEKTMNSLLGN